MREFNDTVVCLRAIFGFVEEHGEPDLAAGLPVDAVVMVAFDEDDVVNQVQRRSRMRTPRPTAPS